ncbi:uncharacterized protein V1516DRAFT_665933 [Lipomyces oligophaga]|uniref:uncharacterized protein n=1 Tax=Lipomyces oligophaga TaxID=45792 RepID=UPI0034CD29B3
MVPETVDERIIQEHLLRDKFYSSDYSGGLAVSSSTQNSLLAAGANDVAGFAGLAGVVLFIFVGGSMIYVVLKALSTRRKDSLLPVSVTPPQQASPTFSAISPASSSSSIFSSPGSGVYQSKERFVKPVGAFEKLFALMSSEDRLRMD